MPATIVVGTQWGDEGKGRIIDLLSEDADLIVRFQGGSNAGHTLIDEKGNQVILHLVPSGILWRDKTCVIGNGVVVEPEQLVQEIWSLQRSEYLQSDSQLVISDACHLVMPYHKTLDRLEEEARGKHKIGTTGRGIGPAYMDKVGRSGIRMGDLLNEQRLRNRLAAILPLKKQLLEKMFGDSSLDEGEVIEQYLDFAKTLSPYVKSVPPMLSEALTAKKNILFEGAQGSLLDIDHGTYPYVTSSNTLAGAALMGAGIGPRDISRVIGIVKAYTTRVGEGPFPTEDEGEDGERLGKQGNEFGATTGRKRRCGWLDIAQLKQSFALNSIDQIILTKLDVLSGFSSVKICIGYELNGRRMDHLPASSQTFSQVTPVYEEFPGWELSRDNITTFDDLPKNARLYVRRIEELLERPIVIASVGPKRQDFLSHLGRRFSSFV